MFEPYDQELLNSLSRNSFSVYAEFKQRVMDARKISPARIGDVAEGRVFIASDAKANGLIDEIGGLDAAVKKAAQLAKITKYGVQEYPKQITFLEMLRKAGIFNFASEMIARRDLSPQERLERYIEKTLTPKEWLFFCPFRLD